jgi:ribosomal-protein-serine acetyltransferase
MPPFPRAANRSRIRVMVRNPVLIDLPESFETRRLLLRCPRDGDGVLIHEAVEESYPELHGVMYWARAPARLEECEGNARLARARYLARKDMWLLLFRREDGRLVGSSGLHNPDWSVPKFEIGYWMRTSETGKGYATEAVAGITRFAFEHLNAVRVEIQCDARNERSAAVPRRLGYELEGTLRSHRRAPDGTLADTLLFALTDVAGLADC